MLLLKLSSVKMPFITTCNLETLLEICKIQNGLTKRHGFSVSHLHDSSLYMKATLLSATKLLQVIFRQLLLFSGQCIVRNLAIIRSADYIKYLSSPTFYLKVFNIIINLSFRCLVIKILAQQEYIEK